MAGSRRSPVLREDWRGGKDSGDRNPNRGPEVNKTRDREQPKAEGREFQHRSRPRGRGRDHRRRSSPPFRRGGPGHDIAGKQQPRKGSKADIRGRSPSPRGNPRYGRPDPRPQAANRERLSSRSPERNGLSAAPPPLKRRRTRSPSTENPSHPQHRHRQHRHHHHESRYSRSPETHRANDTSQHHSDPNSKSERASERGGTISLHDHKASKTSEPSESGVFSKPRRSLSPDHMSHRRSRTPNNRLPSPGLPHKRRSLSRSPSPESRRAGKKLNSSRRHQSTADAARRPDSPSRPFSSFDDDGGHSPPSGLNTKPPSGPQGQQAHHGQSHRGGPPPYRGGHQFSSSDRRFSGSSPHANNASQRGKSHFNSLQWAPSGPRGRGQPSPRGSHTPSGPSSPIHRQPSHGDDRMSPDIGDGHPPSRPHQESSKLEDRISKPAQENGERQRMPPPEPQNNDTSTSSAKESGKFSFAFKSKAAPTPVAKPVPDLAQRMQAREPPPRVVEPPPPARGRLPPSGPASSRFKHENRHDRRDRDRDRDRHRNRERDQPRPRDRDDRRDFRDRDPREPRDGPRDGPRRIDPRHDARREERRPNFKNERRRERSPPRKPQKKIVKRMKPRPTLAEEFVGSESVYYRKPGNESVIGAGTYGKVFKAIHIYTKDMVALKKIRMEGEKDGFPVTAVREIKLLQHLRNHNVVNLREVMVEKNECFMVFEYLAHDLTGLINHPTFTLTDAHKKDLAKQMFEGLNYLHHRSVLHRDIKAANILISNRGQLKLADFGLARFFSKSRQLDYTNRVITIWYRPPELLLGETRYGAAVDVWSAACVYVEMFTKKAVFPGDGSEINQLDKLYNCLGTPTRADWPEIVDMPWFEMLRHTERKKRVFEEIYGKILSPAALDLVAKMFHYNPAKRPTAEEVLSHPYFISEEPVPQQATELEKVEGDWHEFESKALRKEKDREAKRAAEQQKEKEKRKASGGPTTDDAEREAKRMRQDSAGQDDVSLIKVSPAR